jgi:hypothetical protein
MPGKQKISTVELTNLVMLEIRQYPECAHVSGVGFTRQIQIVPHHPNWAPAFTCDAPRIAPTIAFQIAQKLQDQYDLR